jgi:hypothetical protein
VRDTDKQVGRTEKQSSLNDHRHRLILHECSEQSGLIDMVIGDCINRSRRLHAHSSVKMMLTMPDRCGFCLCNS